MSDKGISAGAKILVFWDVVDYPIPEGRSMREILSFLREDGHRGEVSIKAYGETEINPFPEADEQLGGEFAYVPSSCDKYFRLHKLLVDVAKGAFDHPDPKTSPTCLLVVANNTVKCKQFPDLLEELNLGKSYTTYVVIPDGTDPCFSINNGSDPSRVPINKGSDPSRVPRVRFIWHWNNFLKGVPPMSKSNPKGVRPMSKSNPKGGV